MSMEHLYETETMAELCSRQGRLSEAISIFRELAETAADPDEALVHHRVGDLEEAGDVGAVDVVAGGAVLGGGVDALLVDGLHDAVQAGVDLFARPGEAQAVLRHLEAGGGHAAGVGGLAGTVEDAGLEELLDAFGGRSACWRPRRPRRRRSSAGWRRPWR
jgi:hypothetical protein